MISNTSLIVSMLAAGGTSYLAIKLLRPVSHRIQLLDLPDQRKQHQGQIPLIGGLSIYVGLLVMLLVASYTEKVIVPDKLYYLFLSSSLVLLAGLVDDLRGLGAWTRIVMLLIACSIMIKAGNVYVQDWGDLVGLGNINIGLWGIPFTIFAVVGLVNAFNMMDGIDGLAGFLAIVTLLGVLSFEAVNSNFRFYYFLLIFISALLPYLLTNLNLISRRKIFLGDAGSMFVGFVVAWILIELSQGPGTSRQALSPVDVLWCVAIPVYDTLTVIIKRLIKSRPIFAADREHIHHVLIKHGLSHTQVLGIVLLMALGLVLIGLAFAYWLSNFSFMAFWGLAIIYVCGMLVLDKQAK